MDKKEMFKTAALVAVSVGVNKAVSNVRNEVEPDDSTKLGKALSWIGFAVIGAMIADKAYDYMEPKIKGAVEYINKIIVEVKDKTK